MEVFADPHNLLVAITSGTFVTITLVGLVFFLGKKVKKQGKEIEENKSEIAHLNTYIRDNLDTHINKLYGITKDLIRNK